MNQDISKQVEELRKKILTIEWDINYIENKELRAQKEWILNQYKKELGHLLKKEPKKQIA